MPALISTLACVYMSIVNTSRMHLWSHAYMSAFVPSTLQLMHLYTSVVNTMPSTQVVIIMCVHWQQPVCLCTFTTKVCVLRACPPKPNVHNACIAFDPCMCVCQSSTQALCGVDNNPNMCHLRICLNRLQPNSTSYVYDKLVCMSLMYVHASIAFTPCMCVYVNCQPSPMRYRQ